MLGPISRGLRRIACERCQSCGTGRQRGAGPPRPRRAILGLNGLLYLHVGEGEPGSCAFVYLGLLTGADGQDLKPGPAVGVLRGVGWREEAVDDAVPGGLLVEATTDIVFMEVEVELPAVAEFGWPGGQLLQSSSSNFLGGELSDADERDSLQLNVA
ncbi:hypothetical protein [Streptomyces sp. S1D4-20]|uniref:hypothetical protein n=1 Tax=Streptomyces sp. S1D4-20 TaxID=2594462 RepID=UPI001161D3B6|nr:hypothetical protein [Streptomyces sp. S1D4-20]QDN54095.1 hypothetical protein FNV67_00505 [Streptomyces sp. S1D4-20]